MTRIACETSYPSVHFSWTLFHWIRVAIVVPEEPNHSIFSWSLFYWIRVARVVPEDPSHSIPQCIAPS